MDWCKICKCVTCCCWEHVIEPVFTLTWRVSEEVKMLKGIHKDVRNLFIDAHSKAATAKGDEGKQIREIAQHLRILDFRIEDVFEEWELYVSHEGLDNIGSADGWLPCDDDGCCMALPCENVNWGNCIRCVRLQIAMRIKKIKSDVIKIKERCETDGIRTEPSSSQGPVSTVNAEVAWKNLGRKPYNTSQREPVGLEAPIIKLTNWLEDRRAECSVMVVVGMAGQGKTTLAWQFFDKEKVIEKISWRSWINVSDFDDLSKFLVAMLEQLYEHAKETPPDPVPFSDMNLDSLTKEVKRCLRKTRYVLFFDDVWNINFWQDIGHIVSHDGNGSRIIITTRNEEVANALTHHSVEVHQMQPLTETDSLNLFEQNQNMNVKGLAPNKYANLRKDVVKVCAGLPLGIVAICKHITAYVGVFGWKRKIEETGITDILCLSYDNLPDHLKPCLLYFGIYPQYYQVKSKRLIRQWIAEGFVKGKMGSTIEEVAEEYLTCLVNRNLVQVSSFTIDVKPKSCHVHYLVHDMILRKFEDSSFCLRLNDKNRSDVMGITRHLSIATSCKEDLHDFFGKFLVNRVPNSFIRSLHFFTNQQLPEDFVSRIPAKRRPLKVLDFENSKLLSSVKNLGELIHLKYLSLRSTKITCLPRSIGKLKNLETLDVRQTVVYEIPKEVSKLRKLRHLLGDEMSLIELKDDIKDMTSLQILRNVKLDDEVIEEELGKLWQLQDLGLTNVKDVRVRAVCSQIRKIQHLKKLCIVVTPAAENEDGVDLQDLNMSAELELQRLRLKGKLKSLPNWGRTFDHLLKLVLSGSKLMVDPLNSLKDLPYLSFLSIIEEAYEGESLVFQDGGFGDLEELELGSLKKLSSIIIQTQALPSLKRLHLTGIGELTTVPSGIQHLKKLADLNTKEMGADFEQSIAPGGQQRLQISVHIPHLRINGVLVTE